MSKKKKSNKIISKQVYKIERVEREDGMITLCRTNDGFNYLELLGVMDRARTEIIQQMPGAMSPPEIVVKLKAIKRK